MTHLRPGPKNPEPTAAATRPRGTGTRSLAPKLILCLTVVFIVVHGIAAIVTLDIHQRQILDEMIRSSDQISGTIVHGTWNAMLADRRSDAYAMMKNIARQPGIETIRIFNKEGRVMFTTAESGAGALVDKSAEACDLCHAASEPLVRVDVPSRARVFSRASGGRVLGMVTPIYNEPSCSDADCHAHPAETQVLGVLDVDMSLDRVDAEMAAARLRALAVTLMTVALSALLIVVFVRRVVGRPIRTLIDATQAVSAMELEDPIEIGSRDEFGELAHSFDTMRLRLREALTEINRFTQELERKVEERSEQLRTAQENLIRQDRLASLGQLSASMAHEINNPITGIRNLASLTDRILREDGIPEGRVEEFRGYLVQIQQESTRVGRIVTDLLSFSRQSRPCAVPSDLNTLVRNTLGLIGPKLSQARVWTRLELAENLPPVPCDKAQMMQVVMNLVMNAAEALPQGGRVTIRTGLSQEENAAVLEVVDAGSGIPAENLAHIFDPFYTTKEEGKGVGLGLAVVYGIVNAHGGTIGVRSRPGMGTTARVSLSLHEPVEALPDESAAAESPAGPAAEAPAGPMAVS